MAPKRSRTGFSVRQDQFIREYLIDLDGRAAAIRCGYSAKTAHVQASRLLSNAKIWAEVEKRRARKLEKLDITADRVIRELALLGFSNMQDYISINGCGDAFVNLSELDRDRAAAIQEITVEHYTEGHDEDAREVKRTKFKLSDKRGSLELLGKHLGIFEPNATSKKDRLEELMRAKLGNAGEKAS